MLIRYDTIADAKYITLLPEKQKKGVVVRTKKIHPWLLVDYDKDGNMFGIEILNASENKDEDVFEELFGVALPCILPAIVRLFPPKKHPSGICPQFPQHSFQL